MSAHGPDGLASSGQRAKVPRMLRFHRKPKDPNRIPAWKHAQITESFCRKQQGWTTYDPKGQTHGSPRR